jgi:V/A-type H+-transporting ATPase subunit A
MSYSLYVDFLKENLNEVSAGRWYEYRSLFLKILQREAELLDIVRLVGPEALPEEDKLLLETARMIREAFLQQNEYDINDAYSPLEKGVLIMNAIVEFYNTSLELVKRGVPVFKIRELKSPYLIYRFKLYPLEEARKLYEEFRRAFKKEVESLLGEASGG